MEVSEEEAESLPIIAKRNPSLAPGETGVYHRRWWVMAVFCTACFTQALVWNTWGPITESSEAIFSWDDSNIGMLANYGNIGFLITVLPACWFMDVKGLRLSMILSAILMAIGTAIRCISLDPTIATWTANLCSVLNGIAGTVPFAGPALIASVWFPVSQRATATAIASFSNYFGVAMSFVIGPQLVSDPSYSEANDTNSILNRSSLMVSLQSSASNTSNHSVITNTSSLKTGIQHLLYIHVGLAGFVFLATVAYFPSKPPLPPSITASIKRTSYMKGLMKLITNLPFWLIVLAYAVPTGVLGVWASVLDVNINHLNVGQKDAGWMGFYQTLAGCTAGLVIARFSDLFMRRIKLFLILLFICAVISTAWFTALCNKYIPFQLESLYASCILIGVFVNGAIPLFYEIACEASYPVAEGVTGGFLTLGNNFLGILFLLLLLFPGIGKSWMNWCLLGSTVLAVPLLMLFPEKYRRTDIDITIDIPPPTPTSTDIQTKSDNSIVQNGETTPLLSSQESYDSVG